MIGNDNRINMEIKTIESTKWQIAFDKIRIYITIYHTNQLLYCKGHIQIMSNDSTINVETKNNRMMKMTK